MGILTDIGTEEMAHFEMVATIVHQLTRNLTPEEIKESGFGEYYIDNLGGALYAPLPFFVLFIFCRSFCQ